MADRQTDTKKRKRKNVCSGHFVATLDQRGDKVTPSYTSSGPSLENPTQKASSNFFFQALMQLTVPESALSPCRIFFLFQRAPCAFVPTKSVPLSICSVKTLTTSVNDPWKRRVTSCHPSFLRKASAPPAQQRKKYPPPAHSNRHFRPPNLWVQLELFFPSLPRSREAWRSPAPSQLFFFSSQGAPCSDPEMIAQ